MLLDRLRATEYSYLDAGGHTYLDYTGAGLPAQAQMAAHAERIRGGCFGNPHSDSPASAASTELIERARLAVLAHFNAPPEEYAAIFTPNATGACRLVGETYPFGPRTRLVLTQDNHNSVNGIREFARSRGAITQYVPFSSPELRVDDDAIRQALAQPRPGPVGAAWRVSRSGVAPWAGRGWRARRQRSLAAGGTGRGSADDHAVRTGRPPPPRAAGLPGAEQLQRGAASAALDKAGARVWLRRAAGRGRVRAVEPAGPVRGQARFRAGQLVQGVRLSDRRRLPDRAAGGAGAPVASLVRRRVGLPGQRAGRLAHACPGRGPVRGWHGQLSADPRPGVRAVLGQRHRDRP